MPYPDLENITIYTPVDGNVSLLQTEPSQGVGLVPVTQNTTIELHGLVTPCPWKRLYIRNDAASPVYANTWNEEVITPGQILLQPGQVVELLPGLEQIQYNQSKWTILAYWS
jgi:hypothetical protein